MIGFFIGLILGWINGFMIAVLLLAGDDDK